MLRFLCVSRGIRFTSSVSPLPSRHLYCSDSLLTLDFLFFFFCCFALIDLFRVIHRSAVVDLAKVEAKVVLVLEQPAVSVASEVVPLVVGDLANSSNKIHKLPRHLVEEVDKQQVLEVPVLEGRAHLVGMPLADLNSLEGLEQIKRHLELVISSSSSSSSSSSQVPLGKVLEHSDRALALSEGRSVGAAVAAVHSVVVAALQTLVDQHLLLVV